MLKRVGGLLAAVAIVGGIGVAEAGTASADPGFCGVRESGPTPVSSPTPGGPNGFWIYTIHNKCAQAWNMTAVIGGRANFCWSIPPGGSHGYSSIAYDSNWRASTC